MEKQCCGRVDASSRVYPMHRKLIITASFVVYFSLIQFVMNNWVKTSDNCITMITASEEMQSVKIYLTCCICLFF